MSEITDTIQEMRLEEAAEAVLSILEPRYEDNKERTIAKASLFPQAVKAAYDGRRTEGYNYIPSVENREVKEPNVKFFEYNWGDISHYCADELKKYIVWDDCGVRLGTLKEYQEQQKIIKNITDGMTSTFNKRASIINKRGGESVYINVNIFQLPEGMGNEENMDQD